MASLEEENVTPEPIDGPDVFNPFPAPGSSRHNKLRGVTSIDAFPELRQKSTTTNQRNTVIGNIRQTVMGNSSGEGRREESLLLSDSIRLESVDATTRSAVYAMMFAVFADAINISCTAPNYPIMTTPGANADSFPSIEPFGTNNLLYSYIDICIVVQYSFLLYERLLMLMGLLLVIHRHDHCSVHTLEFDFNGTGNLQCFLWLVGNENWES